MHHHQIIKIWTVSLPYFVFLCWCKWKTWIMFLLFRHPRFGSPRCRSPCVRHRTFSSFLCKAMSGEQQISYLGAENSGWNIGPIFAVNGTIFGVAFIIFFFAHIIPFFRKLYRKQPRRGSVLNDFLFPLRMTGGEIGQQAGFCRGRFWASRIVLCRTKLPLLP